MSLEMMKAVYLIIALIEALQLIHRPLKLLDPRAEAGWVPLVSSVTGPLAALASVAGPDSTKTGVP